MKAVVIIPSRYASSRFPGKPLAVIHDKPMVQWVRENSAKASSVDDVYVATDDERIAEVVKSTGGKVLMTRDDHPSGTDRINEAYNQLNSEYDVIINVQGDEPFVEPEHIDLLVKCFEDPEVNIATLIKAYKPGEDIFDENKIRVVINKNMKALYFSRSAIPFVKNEDRNTWQEKTPMYQHIGMYAYRPKTLKELTILTPSALEMAESLEQLRWLENGYDIHTMLTHSESFSVDTPEDLQRLIQLHKK
ncbi:MAG: 3-deoxy-manno-octulosonate cytidylyltransferase (CMP-KDO synthetase) [Patiriisocius sp.]|jgi:3-deoxy-manno-octulosonate cytidylyltransferase (CMP-KDO synthetase)